VVIAPDCSDPDGDPLTLILAPPKAKRGTVTVVDGALHYRAGSAGTDAFGYRATDGRATSAAATVKVTVTQPPAVDRDRVTVVISGAVNARFGGDLRNGDVSVVPHSSRPIERIAGLAGLAGSAGGPAAVGLDLRRVGGRYEGVVVVADPGRKLLVSLVVRSRDVTRLDARTARIELTGTIRSGRAARSYTLTLVVHDGG
jgi:hypothetical protein